MNIAIIDDELHCQRELKESVTFHLECGSQHTLPMKQAEAASRRAGSGHSEKHSEHFC